MSALSFFHCPETLDWIESNAASPVTENWGRLAAASCYSWGRAVEWLSSGRPLSLVALDALAVIAEPQAQRVQEYSAELLNRPDRSTLEAELNKYKERDSVPRVKKTISFLLENSEKITR